jgi:hypothetical protein
MAEIQVQARWMLDAGSLPTPANQSLIQAGDGAHNFYLTLGHLNPPIFDGQPGQELTQEMVQGNVYPVVPVARLLLSTQTLIDLRDKINGMLESVEKARATE